MTKLEEKLIQLGYKIFRKENDGCIIYRKTNIGGYLEIHIFDNNVFKSGVLFPLIITTEWELKNINRAFNQLQKDLEVLKDE